MKTHCSPTLAAAAFLMVLGVAHRSPAAVDEGAEERTPPRLSFIAGDVSFWRPGVEDWGPAQINIPLAPGDALHAAAGGSFEVQIGPRAFARADSETQLRIAEQEPGFLQIEVTSGRASFDLRSLNAGQTIEVSTPNAAFTIESSGYYRVDITGDTTAFAARRDGHATVRSGDGAATTVASGDAVIVQGADRPAVVLSAAPDLDEWDGWNYGRSDQLLKSVSARYVPEAVYGIDELDRHGSWRETPDYGPVWIPTRVAADWAPYSDGRWLWDAHYGWTWVDAAPWGWAPGHYGRWVQTRGYWGWAPGPLVVAPFYAPALVAFFGGPYLGVSIGIGAPAVGWVALGWGEPLVPWWGHRGFVGVPCWRGWGGPRVVNNVVIHNNTVVNVNQINGYRNVHVKNAVIAVREDRFARGPAERFRVRGGNPRRLEPLRRGLPARPVGASATPQQDRGPRNLGRRQPLVRADARPPFDAAPARRPERGAIETRRGGGRGLSSPSAVAAARPPTVERDRRERARPPRPPQQPQIQSGQGVPGARRPPSPSAVAAARRPAVRELMERARPSRPPRFGDRNPAPPRQIRAGPAPVPPLSMAPARVRQPRHIQMPDAAPRRQAPQAAAPAAARLRPPRPESPARTQAGAPGSSIARGRPEGRRQMAMGDQPQSRGGGDSARRRTR